MPRPRLNKPKQLSFKVNADVGKRLQYATKILPTQVSQVAVIRRGIELYIAEAEKIKEATHG